jgi:hypothetical protein
MPGVADGGTLRIVLGTGGTQVTSVIDSFGLEDIGGPLPADQREARRTVAAVLSEMQATDGGARDFHPTQVILRSRRGCTELTQVETATILPALESSDPFTGSTPTPTAPASPTSWYRPLLPREAGCSGADAPFFVDEARADGR